MSKKSLMERPLLVHGVLIGILLVLVVSLVYLNDAAKRLRDQPPDYGPLPAFSLTDQDGKTVTQADLRGKYTVADFIFTRCPGPCAALSRNFREFQQKLAGRDDVQLLSVSVDPVFDKPPVMASYARAYDAEPGRWRFLTGEKEPVYDLIRKGFKVVAVENEDPDATPANLFIHTTRIVLLDPDGNIRGYYDGLRPDEYQNILADIDKLKP